MNSFANRVVLITGAAQGIGRQLALDLAREGAAIAGVDRDADLLAALAADLHGKRVASAVADVTDRDGLRQAVVHLEAGLGPIDVLIANAGIGRKVTARDFHAEDVAAQVRVNLLGVANAIEAVLPGMIARRQGHLVVISSLASYHGLPGMSGYCASKAGVSALVDGLRVELRPLGIATTTICPGWIRTRLTEQVDAAMPGLMELPDATRRMLEAIRQRKPFCAFPTGSLWRVRALAWLPTAVGDWLLRHWLASAARD
jgi:NAD(P)-dependent dehydrogenase (short-subunit alcohol dehydrogenase family)